MIIIDGVLYKTPTSIAYDWNVKPQTAREYIRRYNVPVLKIENRIFVVNGTPKPTSRTNCKREKL